MINNLKLTCIYLVVKDIEKSASFYCSLFKTKIDKRFEDRWIQIRTPNNLVIGLLSSTYDSKKIKEGQNLQNHYDQAFIDNLPKKYDVGNTVVLNLKSDNLKEEYKRVKNLNHSGISVIQYVNFMFPYYFFTVQDPDGNLIEISDN
jgi:predicted lactoylglutathione lyase